MKFLLLLMILPFMVQAQTTVKSEYELSRSLERDTVYDYRFGFAPTEIDTSDPYYVVIKVSVPTWDGVLEALDEYWEECYNDSFQVTRHITDGTPCWGVSSGFGDVVCTNQSHVDKKVWKRNDGTFPGFREYLRRELGLE